MAETGEGFANLVFSESTLVKLDYGNQESVTPKDFGDRAIAEFQDVFGFEAIPQVTENVFSFDVTTNESYKHTSTISNQTIQVGADIADHITDQNTIISITGIVSDYPIIQGIFGGIVGGVQNIIANIKNRQKRTEQAYNALVKFKEKKTPCVLTTGLAPFKDCILKEVTAIRNPQNGGMLEISIEIEQVRFFEVLSASSKNVGSGSSNKVQKGKEKINAQTEVTENVDIPGSTANNVINGQTTITVTSPPSPP